MILIYLQCDTRFNQWMLEKIDNKCVIDYTIDRCKKIYKGNCKIISGVYNCIDNKDLIKRLEKNNVNVQISNEENPNIRFLDVMNGENGEYVIRVGGDQCLLDSDKIMEIIKEMRKESKDWYFDSYSSCILPDIVSVDCLKKWEKNLRSEKRYFDGLGRITDIKRYILPDPVLILYNFRANSNEGLRVCKHVIKNKLNIYELSKKLLLDLINSQYLVKTGLLGSWILPTNVEDFFYDENKNINPWFGKSIVDLLKKHLNKSLRVFEWGSGNSTLFWSQYVKSVISIEHDKKWYKKMCEVVKDNVRLEYYELKYNDEYCKAIRNEKEKFDIISIDGRDRVRCIQNAIPYLKDEGILILDDSERENYKEGNNILMGLGFKKLELSSLVWGIPGYEQFTSIYYRKNNFMGL